MQIQTPQPNTYIAPSARAIRPVLQRVAPLPPAEPVLTTISPAPEESRILRVAAYCRVSTDMEEQEGSFEAQCQHYQTYITTHTNWTLAGIYADTGISATSTKNRTQFARLIEDCEEGLVDFVITKSISRFARNTMDCIYYIRHLKDLGIPILFEKEGLNTGEEVSEFILGIMAGLAEEESKSISKNVKWGLRKRFEAGTYKHAWMPYGFDRSFSIQPEEGEIVRRIYSEVLSGSGAQMIANGLNRDGIPTSQGAPKWDAKSVRAIIKNPANAGDLLYQKTFRDDHFHQKANHGELDQFLDEEHHTPIVSREEFALAQAAMEQRGKECRPSTSRQNRSVLSGKLICGSCGCTMHRFVAGSGHIYRCHGNVKSECTMKNIREDDFKNAFITMINKLSFSQHQESRFRVLDIFMQHCTTRKQTESVKALRAAVNGWESTDQTDGFPEELFAEHVDHAVVHTGERIEIHFKCGLILSEDCTP